jgi:hypothetical protein
MNPIFSSTVEIGNDADLHYLATKNGSHEHENFDGTRVHVHRWERKCALRIY